jgi:hypothetical protein
MTSELQTTEAQTEDANAGCLQRRVRLPRIRIIKNRFGNVEKWLASLNKDWWMMEPMRMGPNKVHIYGIARRPRWTTNIIALEVANDKIVVMGKIQKPKQPNISS